MWGSHFSVESVTWFWQLQNLIFWSKFSWYRYEIIFIRCETCIPTAIMQWIYQQFLFLVLISPFMQQYDRFCYVVTFNLYPIFLISMHIILIIWVHSLSYLLICVAKCLLHASCKFQPKREKNECAMRFFLILLAVDQLISKLKCY